MKYLRIGVGTERVDSSTRRFMIDLGFEATKPSSERVRKAVTIAAVIIGFIAAIAALQATDVEAHPNTTINITGTH